MSLRTAIYLRKSTQDKDEKQIHSIPRQRREVFEYIEKYNKLHPPEERLSFDEEKDVFVETESAKLVGRKVFGTMIGLIGKKRYDVLFCTELSRLSRNAVDTGALVQLLEDKHLIRIQTKDKTFSATPTDKFTLALFLSVSKFENDQRAANTKSGLLNQKERGETTHKVPMGYLNKGEKKGKRWVELDPELWENVRKLWDLMLSGDYSISDLKREGDDMGITVIRKDKKHLPAETTYRNMFTNKYYAGYVKITNTETGEVKWKKTDKHPAMVTDAEFEKVQLILQQRGYRHQPVSDDVSIEAILDEILECGKCTTTVNEVTRPTKMTFEQKTRYTCSHCKHRYSSAAKKACPECGMEITPNTKIDAHRYYRCCKRNSSLSCSHDFRGDGHLSKNLPADLIEKYLDEQISRLEISDQLFEVLKRQLYTLWLQANENIAKQKRELRKSLEDLEKERLTIQRNGLDKDKMSDTEREDHDHLLDDNKRRLQEIEDRIEGLKEDEDEKYERAWQSLQALRDARTILNNKQMGFEPKRKLVLSLVSNLRIVDNKWEVIWKKPFDVLAKSGIAKRGRPKSGAVSDGDESKWLSNVGAFRTADTLPPD